MGSHTTCEGLLSLRQPAKYEWKLFTNKESPCDYRFFLGCDAGTWRIASQQGFHTETSTKRTKHAARCFWTRSGRQHKFWPCCCWPSHQVIVARCLKTRTCSTSPGSHVNKHRHGESHHMRRPPFVATASEIRMETFHKQGVTGQVAELRQSKLINSRFQICTSAKIILALSAGSLLIFLHASLLARL